MDNLLNEQNQTMSSQQEKESADLLIKIYNQANARVHAFGQSVQKSLDDQMDYIRCQNQAAINVIKDLFGYAFNSIQRQAQAAIATIKSVTQTFLVLTVLFEVCLWYN